MAANRVVMWITREAVEKYRSRNWYDDFARRRMWLLGSGHIPLTRTGAVARITAPASRPPRTPISEYFYGLATRRSSRPAECANLTITNAEVRSEGQSFIRRLLLPAIIGLISLAAVLVLWQRLITQQRAKIQVVTSSEILFVKNKIESELGSRILALEQLARRWQVRGRAR